MDKERAGAIRRLFAARFGGAPDLWARAPGRVDLMGSHTDYNLGWVLTLPVSRETWMAARGREDRMVRLHSANLERDACFSLDAIEPAAAERWSNYVRGVAWLLQDTGVALRGFDAIIHSTVPIASGLSSSAALECVSAVVFRALGGWPLDPRRMAQLCQRAENEFVGVNCGILDQFSSCLGEEGSALLLDCRDLSTRAVPFAEGISVLICDTKSRRELVAGEYAQRRARCEEGASLMGVPALRDVTPELLAASSLPPEVAKRCRFIVEENRRVLDMAAAVSTGDRSAIARLCAASSAGARDLFEISSPALEMMMDAMLRAPGIIGARQAGAGFGGCMVAFVEAARRDEFAAAVVERYERSAGLRAECSAVAAAPGAGVFDTRN